MKKQFFMELLTFSVVNLGVFFLLSRAMNSSNSANVFPAICATVFALILLFLERLRLRIAALEAELKNGRVEVAPLAVEKRSESESGQIP